MGQDTKIEWADHSWSPWWGCAKVSAACTNCYAEALANRFRPEARLWRGERQRTKDWTKPRAWDRAAGREGVRRTVFPSMCDPFEDHPALDNWRNEFAQLIAATPNLVWLLLTKRPENIERLWPSALFRFLDGTGWPPNVWVGTTVEDQQRADERIPHLLRIPAAVLFLSCEPLLGPLDLVRYLDERATPDGKVVQWVIAGGESGPRARPPGPPSTAAACRDREGRWGPPDQLWSAWLASLRDQCVAAGVPFLFKQWGEWYPNTLDGGWDRVGKTRAGRRIGGRTWDEVPDGAR
jgi:protein gp37